MTKVSFDQAHRLGEHRIDDLFDQLQGSQYFSKIDLSFPSVNSGCEKFLGHVINGDGIHVEPSKIKDVKNWEALITLSEVHSLLIGRDKLFNAPVLALPDGPEDFVVYCDTSGLGLGCVLMQR
ncbi:putative reverse transcriptase domain-containing protein, partial [Tanacetum coccineum]